ncbi:unnamed protein product [Vitrella brassicaformis CCMP3155]|uniref:Elongation of fatty acids protein n=1 Tax=Vitrella brassicaformis (strain CCMP3155) TaxID=1169540 RepID=A0A0G4G4V6_VITBC|nr:unnamed protein product [Vitrella brassicaformis CCMP3155]|eukprot:CEM23134.1 unnamed protein product [Vitrella brassicaformis CCMP3155]
MSLVELQTHLDDTGDKVLSFFNPDLPADPPNRGRFLLSGSEAFLTAAAYVLFVTLAPLLVKALFGNGNGNGEGSEDAKAAGCKTTVLGKFAREPILFVTVIYNAVQVGLCSWMVWAAIDYFWRHKYKLVCNAYDPHEPGMAWLVWVFYLSKVLDFLDSVFIVVRRKWRQLSFLHTYHHTTIFLCYWLNANAGYDGDVYLTIILNGTVHIVMYFYYLVRTLEVPVPKLLKQAITHLQKVQFVLMNSQAAWLLANGCPYPPRVTWMYLIYIISLLLLFQDFANREYGKKKKTA